MTCLPFIKSFKVRIVSAVKPTFTTAENQVIDIISMNINVSASSWNKEATIDLQFLTIIWLFFCFFFTFLNTWHVACITPYHVNKVWVQDIRAHSRLFELSSCILTCMYMLFKHIVDKIKLCAKATDNNVMKQWLELNTSDWWPETHLL